MAVVALVPPAPRWARKPIIPTAWFGGGWRGRRELQVEHAWLTLGSAGSVVWSRDRDLHSCPAMVTTTLDTVGAGDAFLSVAALCSRVGADLSLASILANLAGASAANIVGNREPVRMEDIVKNARSLLKSRVAKDQARAPRTAHPATPTPTA